MILSALLGFGVATTDVVDDKIYVPILEQPEVEPAACPDAIILAYTADGKKYICKGIVGPDLDCTNTEEILSQLG